MLNLSRFINSELIKGTDNIDSTTDRSSIVDDVVKNAFHPHLFKWSGYALSSHSFSLDAGRVGLSFEIVVIPRYPSSYLGKGRITCFGQPPSRCPWRGAGMGISGVFVMAEGLKYTQKPSCYMYRRDAVCSMGSWGTYTSVRTMSYGSA